MFNRCRQTNVTFNGRCVCFSSGHLYVQEVFLSFIKAGRLDEFDWRQNIRVEPAH